jgi:hypothetical protein
MNKKPTKAKNHNLSITNAGSSDRAVRARRTPNPYPTEDEEQMALAKYLNARFGDRWEHVPGQRWAKVQYLRKLKLMGARKGSLDIRIYEPVYTNLTGQIANGVGVETKRQKGGKESDEQKRFAQMLRDCGWLTILAYGAQDAINKIEEVYGKL